MTHNLVVHEDAKLIQQKRIPIHSKYYYIVKKGNEKYHKEGFIDPIDYSSWLENIILTLKPNGEIRYCKNFRDLNKAYPKDNFPLTHIDIIMDSTIGHEILSFMYTFSSYNQIRIHKEDQQKKIFTTPWGMFCWVVMPFSLKNARETYQRVMMIMLHDLIHKLAKVYVHDIIIKSTKRETHQDELRVIFKRMRKFNLKLHPRKCIFKVFNRKLHSYMSKGI